MQYRNHLSILALVLAAAMAATQLRTEAQGPRPLFDDVTSPAALPRSTAPDAAGPRVIRARVARLRGPELDRAARAGVAGDRRLLLQLNLFTDADFAAVFERHEADGLGHQTWVGRVAGDDLSTVTLTWRGETIAGAVQTGREIYRLSGTMGSVVVEQIDPATFGEELEPVRVPPGEMADAALAAPSGLHRPQAGEVADILVYYTTAAKTLQGGQTAIEALIATAVADANTAYTRSGVGGTLRLAAAVEAIGYVENSDMSADLSFIQANASVAAARNAAGADLVALIVRSVTGGACGIGYLGPSPSYAHSVSARDCIAGNYTFSHEVGHNFGSHHDPDNAGGGGAFRTYSYGYRSPAGPGQFRTVMAYAPGTRILNFSNPAVLHTGLPTGTATQNNALSLGEAFPIVQSFRTPAAPPAPPGAPRNVTASATGNTVFVSWTAPAIGTPTNYLLQVGTSPGGGNIFNGSVGLVTSASGPLPGAGTYYIRAFAQNATGVSPASNEVTLTLSAPATIPGAPQNLTGSAGGPLVSVSWAAPATGGPVIGYLVQAGTSPGGANVFNGAVGLVTSASGALGPGTYYIRVFAMSVAGTSAPSNELVVTVGASCTVPAAPVLTGSKSGSVISISWTTPSGGPVTSYTVQAGSTSGSSGFFSGPVGLTNTVSAAVGNGPYFIRVIANAVCGSGGASNEVALTIP